MAYYDDIKAKFENEDKYSLYPSFGDATLRVELSNICNHECIFCLHNKMKTIRKQGEIDSELFYRIVKECAQEGVKKAGLFMNGEPFVTRKLPEYIKYCKSTGIEYVFITTNGALVTKESFREVVNAGLDSIKFSVNAGTRESYKKVHGRDDFDKVMDIIRYAYEYRKESGLEYRILSSCVVTDDVVSEMESLKSLLEPYVDDFVFFHAMRFSGESELSQAGLNTKFEGLGDGAKDFVFEKPIPCYYPFTHINISYEGFLTLCNEDALNKNAIADLNTCSVKEAWYGNKMVEIRRKHLEKKIDGIQCFNCRYDQELDIAPLDLDLYERSCI